MNETNNGVRFRTASVRAISIHEGGEGNAKYSPSLFLEFLVNPFTSLNDTEFLLFLKG